MAVNYALKFADAVDARFVQSSLTSGIVNRSIDWVGVETVKVFSRGLATLNDYETTGSNRYGAAEDLGNAAQEMKVTQDKSFTFVIDRKTEQDTNGTMEAAAALAENIDNLIVPAIDTYRIGKLVAGAPTAGTYSKTDHTVTGTVTKANAYEEFLKVQEVLDDDKAPQGGRVVVVTPAFHNLIKLDAAFTKQGDLATGIALNGQVGEIDGVPCIKVPKSYFPADVDFVITNPVALVAAEKLTDYIIHDNPPGINGFLVEGRVRFDAFVFDMKKDAVGVHKKGA